MINKLFQITIVLILFFNLSKVVIAEENQNLANFIIRNYESTVLPVVGSSDADFTIIDIKKVIEIKNENIQSKCGWSPFNGYKFKGTPVVTIVNGEIKMKNGELLGKPSGKPMLF